MCDRILIMNKGREIISGTPEAVINRSGKGNMNDAYLSLVKKEVINEKTAHTL